jgi:hypothetical protein
MEADTQTEILNINSENESRETTREMATAGGMVDPSLGEVFKSIQQFVAAWEAANGHPDDYIFYRLTCGSGHYELRLSALRRVGEAIQAGDDPATPPRVRQNLSDEERERRRQRMKDFWRKKRGEAADA